ncbi:MAG: septum formation inhibitor Maf [Rheinheimera sp.]|uniref:Maf family protein n=1 Tax=Arsukibacterium sp. UBA3155 TaxID=1946058 RepID=UPI000C97211C|nr:Maf family protein [Arsukibacterium sp. UBA3155]MAD77542.1 septum formation inhibitor Maf [Rheinheimera sp.]|tara:strand:- start:35907 stop:36479 length:573 start_codon:yes stop_codon:yes gene_type:complete
MYPEIALASASPRRRELLQQIAVPFSLVKVDVDESLHGNESPQHYVSRLAYAKAMAGALQLQFALPVLGADTIVVVDQHILGKPVDQADFTRMMQLLSGRCHQVMTAVALVGKNNSSDCLVSTEVCFRQLSAADVAAYWQTGEPCDKAGGYGIQGQGGRFVRHISGSYSAVVGLPLCETDLLLRNWQEQA